VSPGSVPSDVPSTPTTEPSTAPSPSPVPPLAEPPRWTSLTPNPIVTKPFSGIGNQFIFAIVAYGNGFVAVGEDFQFDGSTDGPVTGAIWSSPDAIAWSRIDPVSADLTDVMIEHVATDGRRLVAIGTARPPGALLNDPTRIVWVSDDGRTWRRITSPPPFERDISGIAGGPAGFVAWTGAGDTSSFYRSDDGTTWERVSDGGQPDGIVNAVAPYRGGFIAVGAHIPPRAPGASLTAGGPDDSKAAAWWSNDGRTWAPGKPDDGAGLYGLFVGSDGIIALGGSGCGGCVGPAILWHSDDGRSWRLIGPDVGTMPTYGSDGARIVRYDQHAGGLVSTSPDGIRWDLVPGHLDADATYGFVVGPSGLLILESLPRSGARDQVDGGVLFVAAH